jgi:purine-binding chemotaxis protein CheW
MSDPTVSSGAPWHELARTAAARRADPAEAEVERELLTFVLADAPYAIPVDRVREIVRLCEITPVPRVPEAVLGVIALRGEVVQVVDLRMRLDLPHAGPSGTTRVVVLHGEDERVTGVLVDAVQEVLRVAEDSILPASDGTHVAELCTRGEEFVSILDLDRVLDLGGV